VREDEKNNCTLKNNKNKEDKIRVWRIRAQA
jgi:hypothetical protein